MTRKEYLENGGNAFPISTDDFYDRGMTLRDYFAGQVIFGCMREYGAEAAAKKAYEVADAMLEARKEEVLQTESVKDATTDSDSGFAEWKNKVDDQLIRMTGGASSEFLPDVDYRSMHEQEMSPEEAAKFVIEYAKGN